MMTFFFYINVLFAMLNMIMFVIGISTGGYAWAVVSFMVMLLNTGAAYFIARVKNEMYL